ncbi:MAG TPA: endopygalactorunase [Chitinophagaceae bacterium]|nr:endopygalactorunase [Chitinophagaceae bacterium]
MKFSNEIVSNNSTHIARITKDSIIVISGTTYSFTVDTPEDSGLVSINTTVQQLLSQIKSKDGSVQQYSVTDKSGTIKDSVHLLTGDKLTVTSKDGKTKKSYSIAVVPMAINCQLQLEKKELTAGTSTDLILYLTAGQRTPNATVKIYIPKGITITEDNTTVNVIGRGAVKLKELATQSIGRVGTNYPYHKVGNFAITKLSDGSSLLLFRHLDLRPANGADLTITISNVDLPMTGNYIFKASYSTSKPDVLTSAEAVATLVVTRTIADLERVVDKSLQYKEHADTYTKVGLRWSTTKNISAIQLMQSTDKGKTWVRSSAFIDTKKGTVSVSGLMTNKLYHFRLSVNDGPHKGFSNIIQFYSGKMDIKSFGVIADGNTDNTDKINEAIDYLNKTGGGTLLFSDGIYNVRTVHLKSNVYLFVGKGATIKAIKGADAPEATWFSDKKYRSGLSPTDTGPYADPENYMTKQDVGHHFFKNTMFFGERLDNIKIIGNGYITGNGNLVTGDNVMRNTPDNRTDKMFTLKLCTNLEIGGIYREEDLWYDPAKDEPYYIKKDGSKDFDTDNMLKIDRAGHFVLLATGTDNINVHNTYFAKYSESNVRDIYDFMACNNVTVTNIYSKISSDDIIKPGSDCSLGFTRPARNYKVRNVIGDTNCNLFQIGSETADDIMDMHIDNIYVLGANKAGFSISTNDGAYIKDIHLNCGHTGIIHSRSKMLRTYTPFFISISNRGRILGASVNRYKFEENGVKHDELLVTNVNIGVVENILINGIDVTEVYAGSSFGDKPKRWDVYNDSQRRATPIVAGYKLPDSEAVQGGLNFKLPNGKHTGYIKNISFNDVHVLVKGGNSLADTAAIPPELGVGQYNASNLKLQPSYGLWARHVQGLTVTNSTFNYEKPDNRYVIFLDDVTEAKINGIKAMKVKDNSSVIKLKNSSNIKVENAIYYPDEWGKSPVNLEVVKGN